MATGTTPVPDLEQSLSPATPVPDREQFSGPAVQRDVERGEPPPTGENELLPGFPATSGFIARDPAKTTVIFRRFDQLAVRNLLHLEARLTALEELQNTFDQDDIDFNRGNEPITRAARSWEDFAVFGVSGEKDWFKLPPSVLNHWRAKRQEEVKEYKDKAHTRNLTIVDTLSTIDDVVEASRQAERDARHLTSGLNTGAAVEANAFFNNPLGCGPNSLALIRARWELATAIESSLKEYRAYKSEPFGDTKLKWYRGSGVAISRDVET
jgi:hypothetical protein